MGMSSLISVVFRGQENPQPEAGAGACPLRRDSGAARVHRGVMETIIFHDITATSRSSRNYKW